MTETEIIWNFPGGFAGFCAALAVCAALAALSFVFTRHRLSTGKRIALFGLRTLFFAGILALASTPVRLERKVTRETRPLRIAALFDASSSMLLPGLEGKSRLTEALEMWKALPFDREKSEFSFYTFAEELTPQTDSGAIEKLASSSMPEKVSDTRLLDTVGNASALFDRDGTDWAVLFTDGIDNSGSDAAPALAALAAGRTRFLFLPLETELPMRKYLEFRRFDSPGKAVLNAAIPFEAAVGYSMLAASDKVEFEIVDEAGKRLFHEEGKRSGAGGALSFSGTLTHPALGVKKLKTRLLLNGASHREVEWSCEIIRREKKRVLLCQGTYDWAVRFLKISFSRSGQSDFEVRTFDKDNPGAFIPSEAELKEYDAVILLNIDRKKCNSEMETRLSGYLRNGGGVLFITGNPVAAGEFANSELENLLPVEFDPVLNIEEREGEATRVFKAALGDAKNPRNEAAFIKAQEETFIPSPLYPFSLTPSGEAHPVFRASAGGNIQPYFADRAFVRRAKPGAEVLAVYRDEKKKEHILIALQRFGRGRSVVLATDPLWRWKLSLPSGARSSEEFWENLLGFVGDAGRLGSGGWQLPAPLFPAGKKAEIRFQGARPDNPVIRSENGELKLTLTAGEPGNWKAEWTPEKTGVYELDSGDGTIRRFTVSAEESGGSELRALSPNHFLINRLRAASGVSEFKPEADLTEYESIREQRTALWDRWWILAPLLLIYCADLLIRRKNKLV